MNRSAESAGAALLVKTPGHSPVKTRLAARIGSSAAEGLHLACARAVAAVLAQCAPRIHGYYAVAERSALAQWPGLPVLEQGPGTLGTRLQRVYDGLKAMHRSVLLLGADTPQLHAPLLLRAVDWLDGTGARIVIGPAPDGGFWLFGANRPLPAGLLAAIGYSRADTCAQLLHAVRDLGQLQQLPELGDLDTANDLPMVRTALAALPAPLPEQHQLAALLDRAAAGPGHG